MLLFLVVQQYFFLTMLVSLIIEQRIPTQDEMYYGVVMMAWLWSLGGIIVGLYLFESKKKSDEIIGDI